MEVALAVAVQWLEWLEWDKIYVCNYIEIKVQKFLLLALIIGWMDGWLAAEAHRIGALSEDDDTAKEGLCLSLQLL